MNVEQQAYFEQEKRELIKRKKKKIPQPKTKTGSENNLRRHKGDKRLFRHPV